MTTDKNRMIADARRAARRLARNCSSTYQECLDVVAREAGLAHWSAFLADPVDIRATQAVSGPDDDAPTVGPEQKTARVSLTKTSGAPGGEGIVLGMDNDRLVRSSRQATVLCVGNPGSGKTNGVVLPTLGLSPTASQVVYDNKPELMRAVLDRGIRSHARLISIDLFGDATPAEIERIAFNPLHPCMVAGDDPWTHGMRVASCLIDMRHMTNGYFEQRGVLLLATICSYLTLRPDRIPGERQRARIASLPGVVDWLAAAIKAGSREAFLTMADDMEALGVMEAVEQGRSLASMADRELAGIIETVQRATLVIGQPEVRSTLEPYDAEAGGELVCALEHADQPTTIFVSARGATSAAIASLDALAIDIAVRWRATKGPSARSLQIIVDEAMKLPVIPAVSTMLHEGAPAGTSLLLVRQDVSRRIGSRSWNIHYDDTDGKAVPPRFDHVVAMTPDMMQSELDDIRSLAGMSAPWTVPGEDPGDGMHRHTVMDANGPIRVVTARLRTRGRA